MEHEGREIMTWQTFGDATRDLAATIVDSGFRPDLVLSIARGGLAVGGALAYSLAVKNCFAVNVEYYTGADERLALPVVLPPVPNPVDMTDLKVLIADDVADTGHTLAMVEDLLRGHVAAARSAVLYRKPWSVTDPGYVWKVTDRWIAFPWSADGPIAGVDLP